MIGNLAELILGRAAAHPAARVGMADAPMSLGWAVQQARTLASALLAAGLRGGSTVAVLGENSTEFVLAWFALQLAGCQTALVNPAYPVDLHHEMLDDMRPDAVVRTDSVRAVRLADVPHVDFSGAAVGRVLLDGTELDVSRTWTGDLPGLSRRPLDVAGYMHTSGTTGRPKFCAQSHEYFLRLGQFFADTLSISARDTVFAPLPWFHINPLGYGLIGGLFGRASVLTANGFSARAFWPTVRAAAATVLVLHAPPVEILKRAEPTPSPPQHHVRAMFFADQEFMERFDIPLGVSCYGSTEVGGLSHTWTWRAGDTYTGSGGMSRYGGRPRSDVAWRLDSDGQILIRAERPGVLFSGYRSNGELNPALDDDGWFHTGDLGQVDEHGNLVFIERQAESIRVKGEFVPVSFVESVYARVPGLSDLAIGSRPSTLVDAELLLYVAGPSLPLNDLRRVTESLAPLMRPSAVLRVDAIPRDTGVGKVRRRQLAACTVLDEAAL